MQTTTNLELRKPESSDSANISDLNYNSDILDTRCAGLGERILVGYTGQDNYAYLDFSSLGQGLYALSSNAGYFLGILMMTSTGTYSMIYLYGLNDAIQVIKGNLKSSTLRTYIGSWSASVFAKLIMSTVV